MECRANSSENMPLLLDADRKQNHTPSNSPYLPIEILEIILSKLQLRDVIHLAATAKAMEARVMKARSPYTFESRAENKVITPTYKQVITILLDQTDIAKKRLAEIEQRNDESCYYIPQEDRQCTQTTEIIVAIFGVMAAGLSCSASLVLGLTTPLIWPSMLVCGAGNAAAACPIGLAATSRFYTSRFNREDREIEYLNKQIDDVEELKGQISSMDAGK